jgi:hypothetical protein
MTKPKFNTAGGGLQDNIFYEILDIFCGLGLPGVMASAPLLDRGND